MAARTRVKVDRTKLIDTIKARRKEASEEFAASKERAKQSVSSYADEASVVLSLAAAAVAQGKVLVTSYFDKSKGKHYLKLPDRPVVTSKKFDGSRYDKDIRILEMSSQETIALSSDDFDRYVK